MNPGEVAVCAREEVELRLLTHPKNAERHKGHRIGNETRQLSDEGCAQIAFSLDHARDRHVQVQDQQRHRKRKEAVAERRKTVQVLAREEVILDDHAA